VYIIIVATPIAKKNITKEKGEAYTYGSNEWDQALWNNSWWKKTFLTLISLGGISGRVIKVVDSAHIPNPVRCRSDTHLKC
jgi:hypothetical protein